MKNHLIKNIIIRIFLFAVIISSIISCANPTEIYVKKSQLYKLNKVAVNVSSSELDVKYSRETGLSTGTSLTLMIVPLIGLMAIPAEYFAKHSEDKERTEGVRESTNKYYIEKLFSDYFLGELGKIHLFEVEYSNEKSYERLINKGYDSIIEINIDELSLTRTKADLLNVYVSVWGKMVNLENKKVIWRNNETIMSDEAYPLDKYQSEGGKILKHLVDKMFRKIAFRMAGYINYAK